MICKCIKDIVLISDNGKNFINGNYYNYDIIDNIYCINKPGKPVYSIENLNIIMDMNDFNESFIDISNLKPVSKKIESGPNRLNVINIVDRSLIELLKEGVGFLDVKENLIQRTIRLKKGLEKDMKTCELLRTVDPDILLNTPEFWISVNSSRVKYHLYYITQCSKRINDIDWCLSNRLKFYNYSVLQLFNLIKLKDNYH